MRSNRTHARHIKRGRSGDVDEEDDEPLALQDEDNDEVCEFAAISST